MPGEETGGDQGGRPTHRSGFACLVGRPNTGKSTLTNALVGIKVAITSSRPQTTRHTVRGIVTTPDHQLVLVDTPGLHRPRTLLGQRLNEEVLATLHDVDVVGFCLPADERTGPGDRWIAEQVAASRSPAVALVTKTDAVSKAAMLPRLAEVVALGEAAGHPFVDVVPVSALGGHQVDVVSSVLAAHLPEGADLYPDGELTDESEAVMVAELVREAALEGVRDELPHSLAAVVEEIAPRRREDGSERPDGLTDVHVVLYVERDSQKGIVIGRGGARLRAVGTTARAAIEELLGTKVHLDLRVKVARDWQRDPKQLARLGF